MVLISSGGKVVLYFVMSYEVMPVASCVLLPFAS